MASDEAVRERSSARSTRWPVYRLAAERFACEQSDDVNVNGATRHHVSPPHVPHRPKEAYKHAAPRPSSVVSKRQ